MRNIGFLNCDSDMEYWVEQMFEVECEGFDNPLTFEQLSRRLVSCEVLLATEGRTVVGYLMFSKRGKFLRRKRVAVSGLVVRKEHRRQRVGSSLLHELKRYCVYSDLDSVSVNLPAHEVVANDFFRSQFFRAESFNRSIDTVRLTCSLLKGAQA